jgi:hypothetical protein
MVLLVLTSLFAATPLSEVYAEVTESGVAMQRLAPQRAADRIVMVFLVNGQGDCCMYEASGLINGLRTLDVPGVEIRFAGLDARNLQPGPYNDYTIPWNSLYNRHEHGFDIGENMTRGTENFVRDVSGYLDTLPVGTGLVFIGHSFGGDSVLSLLQAVRQTRRPVLFAGVIDPVDGGGIRNTMRIKDVGGTVQYFFNRWQTNQLWPIDFLSSGSIQCSAKQCDQAEHNHHRNYDGSHERVQCGELEVGCAGAGTKMVTQCKTVLGNRICADVPKYDPGTKRKPVSHSSLPVDAYIQRQMFEAISAQISEFARQTSIILARNEPGELQFYKDLERNGTAKWANGGNGAVIGSGWQNFKFVFGGQDGIIYAVKPDGALEFYQDLARNGTVRWANGGNGKTIGSGWQNFKFVFGGQDGTIYAVTPNGALEFYQDLARNGTARWANGGNGKTIGSGWQNFKFVFGGQDGIIYAVTPNGALEFYQDLARNGTARWANGGNGKTIGSGWQNYKLVFGGDNGVIYAIVP